MKRTLINLMNEFVGIGGIGGGLGHGGHDIGGGIGMKYIKNNFLY